MTTAFDKLTKAKARLVMDFPFFAHIVMSMPFVEDTTLGTMATDGINCYYDPKFVDAHSTGEIQGVLCHEALHKAYMHMLRKGVRHHFLWNVACDYAINPIILQAVKDNPSTTMCLPKDVLVKDEYKNMSANEIYELLLKNAPKISISFPGGGSGTGEKDPNQTPMWGGVMQAEKTMPDGSKQPLSQDEVSQLEQEIKMTVQSAAEIAKSRGKVPGGMEGLIKAVGAPKINWQDYIQSWIKGITPDDYSWVRPNRTWMANYGIYMPRMSLNGSGVGVLSIDTSGSVSDGELIKYITEIVGVIEMVKPDKLYIMQHDAVIQRVDVWEAGMDFRDLKVKGRGGTCIMPTFEYLKTIDEEVNWMICFTDMGICDYPKKDADIPSYPVLWAATGPNNAPFGQYIPIFDAMEHA